MDIRIRIAIYTSDVAALKELIASPNDYKVYDRYNILEGLHLIRESSRRQAGLMAEAPHRFTHNEENLNPQDSNWCYLSETLYLLNRIAVYGDLDDHKLHLKMTKLFDILQVLIEHGAPLDRHLQFNFFESLYFNQSVVYLRQPQHSLSMGRLKRIFAAAFNAGYELNDSSRHKTVFGLFYRFFAHDVSMLEFFLNQGLKLDTYVLDGLTPLMLALLRQNYDQVRFLLDRGASIYQKAQAVHSHPQQLSVYAGLDALALHAMTIDDPNGAQRLKIAELLKAEKSLSEASLSPNQMTKAILKAYARSCLLNQKPELKQIIQEIIPRRLQIAFQRRLSHQMGVMQEYCNQIEAYIRLEASKLDRDVIELIMNSVIGSNDQVHDLIREIAQFKDDLLLKRLTNEDAFEAESQKLSDQTNNPVILALSSQHLIAKQRTFTLLAAHQKARYLDQLPELDANYEQINKFIRACCAEVLANNNISPNFIHRALLNTGLDPMQKTTSGAYSLALQRLSWQLNKLVFDRNHTSLIRKLTRLFKDFINLMFQRPKVCPVYDVCQKMVHTYLVEDAEKTLKKTQFRSTQD